MPYCDDVFKNLGTKFPL